MPRKVRSKNKSIRTGRKSNVNVINIKIGKRRKEDLSLPRWTMPSYPSHTTFIQPTPIQQPVLPTQPPDYAPMINRLQDSFKSRLDAMEEGMANIALSNQDGIRKIRDDFHTERAGLRKVVDDAIQDIKDESSTKEPRSRETEVIRPIERINTSPEVQMSPYVPFVPQSDINRPASSIRPRRLDLESALVPQAKPKVDIPPTTIHFKTKGIQDKNRVPTVQYIFEKYPQLPYVDAPALPSSSAGQLASSSAPGQLASSSAPGQLVPYNPRPQPLPRVGDPEPILEEVEEHSSVTKEQSPLPRIPLEDVKEEQNEATSEAGPSDIVDTVEQEFQETIGKLKGQHITKLLPDIDDVFDQNLFSDLLERARKKYKMTREEKVELVSIAARYLNQPYLNKKKPVVDNRGLMGQETANKAYNATSRILPQEEEEEVFLPEIPRKFEKSQIHYVEKHNLPNSLLVRNDGKLDKEATYQAIKSYLFQNNIKYELSKDSAAKKQRTAGLNI